MVAFFAPVEGGLDRDPDPARAFLPSVAGCFELARFGLAFWTSVPPSEVVAAEAEGADGVRLRVVLLGSGGRGGSTAEDTGGGAGVFDLLRRVRLGRVGISGVASELLTFARRVRGRGGMTRAEVEA